MDKGLQIQVEMHRLGEKIFSRILGNFEKISEQEKREYILSTETVISISDYRIWTYGVIETESGREICTISSFENHYGSRIVIKEAMQFYFINSEYSVELTDEDISERERRTKIKIYPAI